MPIYNFTIDDISPIIAYEGLWGDSSADDDARPQYFNETFHATQQLGATATLSFYGSAVYLFGAFRINHNVYTTTLDGHSTSKDGQSSPSKFQQNMFSATEPSLSRQHNVTLNNTFRSTAAPFVDLDYIIITTGDGNSDTQSVNATYDDTDPIIQYSSGWSAENDQPGMINQSTVHRTSKFQASATIAFHGNAIALYGGTAPDHGLFTVSLDNEATQTFNGSAPLQRAEVLLYYNSGLSINEHTLTVTNVDDSGRWLGLDTVVLSDWSVPASATISRSAAPNSEPSQLPLGFSPTSPGTTPSSDPSASADAENNNAPNHNVPVNLILGVTLGCLALIMVFLVYFYKRSVLNLKAKVPRHVNCQL